jgi:hypothetical protein
VIPPNITYLCFLSVIGTKYYPWFDTANVVLAPDKNITASALEPIAEMIKKGIE